MYVSLEMCFIVVIVMDSFVLTQPQHGTGQKAHFSLEDTPGSFTVHANKMMAKVSSKPDSVKVVVKPGVSEIPLPASPTQKPLLHVVSPAIVRPVGGWNFMSFSGKKRSKIEERSGQERSFSRSIAKVRGKHFKGNLFQRLRIISSGRKPAGKPWKVGICNFLSSSARERNGRKSKLGGGKSPVHAGQKREFVERKMNVQGGTGKFSVHVDQKQTNVSSSTGGVKVFIKNPSPSQMFQLPREMLQLPGAILELPRGMSQIPGPVSQFTRRMPQVPGETPLVVVRSPYDWTGASHWNDDN